MDSESYDYYIFVRDRDMQRDQSLVDIPWYKWFYMCYMLNTWFLISVSSEAHEEHYLTIGQKNFSSYYISHWVLISSYKRQVFEFGKRIFMCPKKQNIKWRGSGAWQNNKILQTTVNRRLRALAAPHRCLVIFLSFPFPLLRQARSHCSQEPSLQVPA